MTDKKVRSKISLTYNTGLRTSASSIITGKITSIAYPQFDHIALKYQYTDSNGAIVENGIWEIIGETEINDLMALIEPLLPPPTGEVQNTIDKFYQGFLLVAAEAWNTTQGDWELIDDIL